MYNPSVRQEARYEPAAVIPVTKDGSLIEWLQSQGRIIAREKEENLTSVEEDVELSELMDVDDPYVDDDDDLDLESED
jgi:hypothetical protein